MFKVWALFLRPTLVMGADILKVNFLCAVKTLVLILCARKVLKTHKKYIICVKHEEKYGNRE